MGFQAIGNYLSQVFLSPAFLGFLGLVPVIILLYLLKLRRTEVVISSTFLWLKSLQDLTANAPFQRLRTNLLMLLQILATILLVIALARPFFKSENVGGANYCVIIDNSASMQTDEDGEPRLDLAKERALEMVDTLSRGDKMMVVAFAESADVLCELTDDRYRIRRAIRGIETRDTRTRLRDVLLVTRSLSPDNPDIPAAVPNLELVLFSDGNLTGLDEEGPTIGNLSYVKVGSTNDNVGLVRFSVRQPEDSDDEQTFLLLHNESEEAVRTTVTLYYNDNALAVEEVELPPQSNEEVLFAHEPLEPGILRAEVDHEDALGVDNVAWLAIRPETKVRALIVSDAQSTSGYFLRRALSLEPRVTLSTASPEDYVPTNDFDLVFFDGFAPEQLPQATCVFFNAVPAIEGLSLGAPLENPQVVSFESEHPVMRFLNLGKLSIAEASPITLPQGSQALISSGAETLAADVSRRGRQLLVFGFDVGQTNWPTLLSFPLFLQNTVSWTPRSAVASELSHATGAPLTVWPREGAESATVTLPNGQTEALTLEPGRPAYFGNTQRAGLYTVAQGGHSQPYAVNLLDQNESSVGPKESLDLSRGQIASVGDDFLQTKELWRWFVVAAIVILCAEWWIYSRRAWM